jgi:hypothetical protein
MISIQMYIADPVMHFSQNLTEDFLRFWGCRGLEYPVSTLTIRLPPPASLRVGSQHTQVLGVCLPSRRQRLSGRHHAYARVWVAAYLEPHRR